MGNDVEKKPVSNIRLAVRNSMSGFLSVVTQLIGNSLAFFIIARIPGLTVSDFGMLTYAIALSQLFAIFFEYGLGPYIAKESAALATKEKSFETAVYGLHLSLMVAGVILFLATLSLMDLDAKAKEVCIWAGTSVFVTTTFRFFFAFYQGREKIYLELFSTLSEVVILAVVIGAAFINNADIVTVAKYFFYGRLVSWVLSYLLFGKSVNWLIPRFDWLIWKKMLVEAAPFGFTFVIAFAITSIDTIMLRELSEVDPEYQVGLYQAAMRLILIPTIAGLVVTKVFLPQLSRMGTSSGASMVPNLRRLNDLLLSFGILAGLFIYYRADSLIFIAYGDQFKDAAALVSIMAFTLMLRFGAAYNLYFTLNAKMWIRVAFSLVGLTSTIVFNFFFIPKYGAIGSAYASLLSHVVYWLPFLIFMKIYEGEFLLGWKWPRAIIAAAAFALLLELTKDISLLYIIPVSGLYISIVLFLILEPIHRKHIVSNMFGKLK